MLNSSDIEALLAAASQPLVSTCDKVLVLLKNATAITDITTIATIDKHPVHDTQQIFFFDQFLQHFLSFSWSGFISSVMNPNLGLLSSVVSSCLELNIVEMINAQ